MLCINFIYYYRFQVHPPKYHKNFLGAYIAILERDDKGSFGFSLTKSTLGHFEISRIKADGSAYKNGRMAVGHRVIAINDVKIEESMSLDVITTIIRESENKLKLVLSSQSVTPGKILHIGSIWYLIQ